MNTTIETQNITLAIPKGMLQEVKLIAGEQGQSISGLMTQLLQELVDRRSHYRLAQQRQMALMETGLNLGTEGNITWSRDSLYER